VGEGRGRALFPTLIRPDGHLLPREKVFLRFFETVDSATSGMNTLLAE